MLADQDRAPLFNSPMKLFVERTLSLLAASLLPWYVPTHHCWVLLLNTPNPWAASV